FVLLHYQPPIQFRLRPFLIRRCLKAARALPPLDALKGFDPPAGATRLFSNVAILRLDGGFGAACISQPVQQGGRDFPVRAERTVFVDNIERDKIAIHWLLARHFSYSCNKKGRRSAPFEQSDRTEVRS